MNITFKIIIKFLCFFLINVVVTTNSISKPKSFVNDLHIFHTKFISKNIYKYFILGKFFFRGEKF